GLLTCILLCLPRLAKAQEVPVGRLLPVAVKNGRCDFVLSAAYPDDAFYLIVGSLARQPGSRTISVHTEASAEPVKLELETRAADEEWSRRMRELDERLARARRDQPGTAEYSPAQEPPRRRAFYLFCEEHDFENPSNYVTIEAELRGLGRHCQVYVDRACTAIKELQPAIDDALNTFDGEIYPRTRQELGQVLDVDRDGRFTMLFTSRLGKLSGGKVALSGFVRGSDWYRDLPTPFGNRCDMMYLNTNLKPGPYLHSVLVHEYTHAISFSEHVFGNYLPEAPRHDEEGWLNEGLAHL